jgi:hypothetical protein
VVDEAARRGEWTGRRGGGRGWTGRAEGAVGVGVTRWRRGAVGPRVLLDGAEGAVGGGAEDRGVRAKVADRG